MRSMKSDKKFVMYSDGRNINDWDISFVSKQIENHKVQRGCDIGGGIGKFANLIVATNDNISSIDVIDPSTSAHKNFIHSEKVKLIKGTVSDVSISRPYDFIMVNYVCHHIISSNDKKTFDVQVNF